MEVDEPEADKYFSLKKSVCIPPRHYAITQIQCKSLTGPVTIKPDQVFKRDNLSMWIDTYYVDPNQGKVTASTQLTINSQVNNTQVDQDNIPSNFQTNQALTPLRSHHLQKEWPLKPLQVLKCK